MQASSQTLLDMTILGSEEVVMIGYRLIVVIQNIKPIEIVRFNGIQANHLHSQMNRSNLAKLRSYQESFHTKYVSS